MKRVTVAALCAGLAIGAGSLLVGQGEKRASPHETATATIAGKKITIEYGRPYKKGRVIFGGLEPWEKVWRTGADEATTLTTESDIMLGSIHVPKGTYSIFTLPSQKEWKFIVNSVAKQWGAYNYDQKMDLGRTSMQVETVTPAVEQFTISIQPSGDRKGTLMLTWDTTAASVPIMVH